MIKSFQIGIYHGKILRPRDDANWAQLPRCYDQRHFMQVQTYALHQHSVAMLETWILLIQIHWAPLQQEYHKAGLQPAASLDISWAISRLPKVPTVFWNNTCAVHSDYCPLCDFCVISTQFQSTCFLRGHHHHHLKVAHEATVTDTPTVDLCSYSR